jgi:hypothetical protein
MNDRLLGYFILTVLVAILLIPAVFLVKQNLTPKQICVVEFNNIESISFVSKQDPVRLQGVQIGVVRDIKISNDKTLILLELSKPVKFFKGYTITAFLKGLMGDRYISIQQGDQRSEPLSDNIILKGKFLDGPAEIVAYVGRFRALLVNLNTIVSSLKDGTLEKKSFVNQFTAFYQKVDTLSIAICTLSKNIDMKMDKNKDTIQFILGQVISISDSLSNKLPEILSKTKATLSSTQNFITQADLFISKTDTFVSGIEDSKSIFWQNDIKNLQTDLQSLRKMLYDLRVDGLCLPVRLR